MKPLITKEILEKTENEARVADIFLRDPDFQFIREYINQSLISLKEQLLSGVIIGQNISLTQKQTDQFQGQYQWITKFLFDMNRFVQLKGELDQAIIKGEVKLEGYGKDISESAG